MTGTKAATQVPEPCANIPEPRRLTLDILECLKGLSSISLRLIRSCQIVKNPPTFLGPVLGRVKSLEQFFYRPLRVPIGKIGEAQRTCTAYSIGRIGGGQLQLFNRLILKP